MSTDGDYLYGIKGQAQANVSTCDPRTSEQIMVDLIRKDLGVTIEPQNGATPPTDARTS
jgi:hypothetical protein